MSSQLGRAQPGVFGAAFLCGLATGERRVVNRRAVMAVCENISRRRDVALYWCRIAHAGSPAHIGDRAAALVAEWHHAASGPLLKCVAPASSLTTSP
jgi:hypothetical protein